MGGRLRGPRHRQQGAILGPMRASCASELKRGALLNLEKGIMMRMDKGYTGFSLLFIAFLATGCSSASSGGNLSGAASEPLPSATSSASAASVPSESSDPYDINASMSFDTSVPEDPELDYDYSPYETLGDEANGCGDFWIWEIEPDVWRCGVIHRRSGVKIMPTEVGALYALPCTLTRMRMIVEEHFDRENDCQYIHAMPYFDEVNSDNYSEIYHGWRYVEDVYFYYRLGLLATWYRMNPISSDNPVS